MDADGIHVVQVRTDDLPRGKIQLWFAAVPREQAIAAVLDAVPEGWSSHRSACVPKKFINSK